ncbi:MAG: T9SS type A sorting domain-containing protein [Cryomorphaceae bacterium]|nr:T9SS type A sorting domain-containing protein [Cryomorphaceae bacterium]
MKKSVLILLMIIGSLASRSQSININIIPENPHISDSVKVNVVISYGHLIFKISDSLFISGDTIHIKYCVVLGPTHSPTFFTDTFSLGTFADGDYTVMVKAFYSTNGIDCIGDTSYFSRSKSFQVSETVSVHHETLESDFSLELAPNPTSDFQTLTLKTETSGKIHIEIYDLSGRMVRQVFSGEISVGEQTFIADLRDLKSGTYVYRVRTEEGVYLLKP